MQIYFIWDLARFITFQISLDLDTEVPNDFLYSVNGTHCWIKEPRNDSGKLWFSLKYNKLGVSYEIVLHLNQDKIAWVNGLFKAGESDFCIFGNEFGLKSQL